jgi:hypothetical protein
MLATTPTPWPARKRATRAGRPERIYRAKLRARHLSQDEDEQPRHRSFAWPPYLRTEDEEIEDEEIEDEEIEDEDERSWADDLEEAVDEQEVDEEE